MQELRSIRSLSKESLRGIEPAKIIGRAPRIEWVDPKTLFVEDEYQRTMESGNSTKLIRNIISAFSWSRFKPPICVRLSESGNALVIVDGQHSATAAASHPEVQKIPIIIVDAASIANRAKAFVGHNKDRVGLTQFAIFRAELAAGDEIAAIVERACKTSGAFVLASSVALNRPQPVGATIAIGTLRQLARAQGEQALTRVLRILVKAQRGPIKAQEIAATAIAIDGAGDIDQRLAAVIAKNSAERWGSTAASLIADTNVALPIALATLWREELGLSRPKRQLRYTGNNAARVLRPQKPAPVQKEEAPKPAAKPVHVPVGQPRTMPAPQARSIERDGIRLDLDRHMLRKNGTSVQLTREEAGAVAILVKVMPSVLPNDRIAEKAFGSFHDAHIRVRSLVTSLQPKLGAVGLKLREVPKMGFALGAAA